MDSHPLRVGMESTDGSAVWIVISVIHFARRSLSFSQVRSQFSPEVRAEQTRGTIASIKTHMPDAKIVLVEMGTRRDLPADLTSSVFRYLYLGDKVLVRKCCDSRHRGLGEAVGLLVASRLLPRADYYFKISGRYFLSDRFDRQKWRTPFAFHMRRFDSSVSTRLYGFPASLLGAWRQALLLSVPFLLLGKGIEQMLPRFIPSTAICYMPILGVSGWIAPNGAAIDE